MDSFAPAVTWLFLNQLFEDDKNLTPYLEDSSGRMIADYVVTHAKLSGYEEYYESLAELVQMASQVHQIIDNDFDRVRNLLRDRKVLRTFFTPNEAKQAIEALEKSELPKLDKADLVSSIWLALKTGEFNIKDFNAGEMLVASELQRIEEEENSLKTE